MKANNVINLGLYGIPSAGNFELLGNGFSSRNEGKLIGK